MMSAPPRERPGGSRFLYEPFDSAHARIEANERVQDERWASLEKTLFHIERGLDRLERRVWFCVYSVAAAWIAQLAAVALAARFDL